MDHQVLVGYLNRFADDAKELEALPDAELVPVTVVVDRLTVDVFHHQVRQAFFGGATVQQSGDVRMLDTGQNLTLTAKPLQHLLRCHAATDDLDRYLFLELIVANRLVDGADAALTDEVQDLVRTELATFEERRLAAVGIVLRGGIFDLAPVPGIEHLCRFAGWRADQKVIRLGVCGQK